MESDPIIRDREAFKRWLRDRPVKERAVRSYVNHLKRLSRELEIEIGPATVKSFDKATMIRSPAGANVLRVAAEVPR